MADEKPENTSGKGGPGAPRSGSPEEGQGRRSGRHRGYRGRHGGREAASREAASREAASRDAGAGRDALPRAAPDGQAREGGKPRDQREQRSGRPEEAPRQEAPRDMPACPLCGKPVYDLSTALATSREANEPAHFDCVLERVAASESIAAGEKLVYLGSGAFGVVEFKEKNDGAFQVKRRIQWEKEGEKKDWRKGISSRISNL